MIKEWLVNKRFFISGSVSLTLFSLFAYELERQDFAQLVALYLGLFIAIWILLKKPQWDEGNLMASGVIFRLAFLFAIPNLSQDFYRFIWDGRMILEGFNPYLYNPETFISVGELPVNQAQELYDGMGSLSAGNYTNYPPLNQLIFLIAGLFAGKSILGSVIVMRVIIIAADIGTFFFGRKLLKKMNLSPNLIFLYFLNPFVIIELSGNLHFEGVMVFFLIWSLYLLVRGKWYWSALVLACSVSIKLIPLIFLPFLFRYLGTLKSIGYYAIVGVINVLLFLPFYSSKFITNYSETIGLWFQKFEFNASLYYIAREIGYTFRGWNEIEIIGSYIPRVVLVAVLLIALFRNNTGPKRLITGMLFALSIYLFCSTTVHPWYIITLLALSVFTKYRYPLLWSLVIVISYHVYSLAEWNENLWLIALEYALVFGFLFFEVFGGKSWLHSIASSGHSTPAD